MAKYECCGPMYADSNQLTSHMRKDHYVDLFEVGTRVLRNNFCRIKAVKRPHEIGPPHRQGGGSLKKEVFPSPYNRAFVISSSSFGGHKEGRCLPGPVLVNTMRSGFTLARRGAGARRPSGGSENPRGNPKRRIYAISARHPNAIQSRL